jgi:regulator of protease activity HflC (stomatin/prohibitin superfamily)
MDENDQNVDIIATILLYVVLIAAFVLVKSTIKIVHHAEVMIVERFGKFHRTLTPGLYLLIPFVDCPRTVNWRYLEVKSNNSSAQVVLIKTDRIDMREHVIDFGKQSVITKDTVTMDIDALVYFRITDPRIAVFKIENLPDAIELLTQATLRNIIANMTLDDTFSSRDHINASLLTILRPDAERWGVSITRVEIFNINPPQTIKHAMENQIRAERERRSNVLVADGNRESTIVKSRGDAAHIVLLAEGQRAVDMVQATGKAKAKMLYAEAESKSVEYMQAACQSTGIRSVDYLIAIQYLNSIKSVTNFNSDNSKVVLIPSNTIVGVHDVIAMNTTLKAKM